MVSTQVHGVNGFTSLMPADVVPDTIRLTDTLFGNTVTLHKDELDKHVQLSPKGGIIFAGQDVGRAHIHVAYFAD